MSDQDTLEFVAQRRKALHQQRAAVRAKLDDIRQELAALEREDKALTALERALKPERVGNRSAPRELRSNILAAIAGKPEGLTPAEIIDTLGARESKTRQDAIRNALHAMKKPKGQNAQELVHTDGKYFVPAAKLT